MLNTILLILGIFIVGFLLLFIFCALRISSICDNNDFIYTNSLKK